MVIKSKEVTVTALLLEKHSPGVTQNDILAALYLEHKGLSAPKLSLQTINDEYTTALQQENIVMCRELRSSKAVNLFGFIPYIRFLTYSLYF